MPGIRPVSASPLPARVRARSATITMSATQAGLSTQQEELIRRIKAGESDLFYQLIEPYQKSVYAAAYSVLGNEADAEDAAQDALVKCLARLEQFRAEAKCSTSLIQIAINEARPRRRTDRKGLYESDARFVGGDLDRPGAELGFSAELLETGQ